MHTPDPKRHRLRIDPLQAQIVGGATRAIWVLQGAVVFVLLIACANLANLLLARAESRHKEFAVRAALGAGRAMLLRQFMTEGLVLSLSGAALGIVLAVARRPRADLAYPDSLPRAVAVSVDAGVLSFTLAIAILTGAVFGLAPLLHLAPDVDVPDVERGRAAIDGGRAQPAPPRPGRVGGGPRRGARHRRRPAAADRDEPVERGRRVQPVASRHVLGQPAEGGLREAGPGDRVLSPADGATGCASPACRRRGNGRPAAAARSVNANDTSIEGYKAPPDGPFENVDYYQDVTGNYVETMGIPVVEGRAFKPTDATSGLVVLINQTMARTFYQGQSPIGRRVRPSLCATSSLVHDRRCSRRT